jgi:predicted TIM-barrel fold metal-dependent hydrolase
LITPGSKLDAMRREYGLGYWTAHALAEALEPWLAHLTQHFGAGRCLFESNFPVDKAHCTWPVLVEAYGESLGSLDNPARDAIFRGNATRLYRINCAATPGR